VFGAIGQPCSESTLQIDPEAVAVLVLHAGKEVTSAELCEALKIKPSTLANYV
jgi:hypothetical protein